MLALNLPGFAPKVAEKDGKRTIFDPVRQKYVALTPEEWVRQHFVNYLITRKSYPKELLANEVLVKLNGTSKRCDTVAYSRFLEPLVIVEYKAPHINITNTVFDQIARYNMVLRVEYLIVSNGLNHYCCKIDYNNRAYTFLEGIPAYNELKTSFLTILKPDIQTFTSKCQDLFCQNRAEKILCIPIFTPVHPDVGSLNIRMSVLPTPGCLRTNGVSLLKIRPLVLQTDPFISLKKETDVL